MKSGRNSKSKYGRMTKKFLIEFSSPSEREEYTISHMRDTDGFHMQSIKLRAFGTWKNIFFRFSTNILRKRRKEKRTNYFDKLSLWSAISSTWVTKDSRKSCTYVPNFECWGRKRGLLEAARMRENRLSRGVWTFRSNSGWNRIPPVKSGELGVPEAHPCDASRQTQWQRLSRNKARLAEAGRGFILNNLHSCRC